MDKITKTALITGGSKRIGKQICLTLHATHNIIIHYNNSKKEAQELANTLNKIRIDSTKTITGDLTKEQDINTIILQIKTLNLLVNNASSFYPTPINKITISDFETIINTNILAPLLLSTRLVNKLKTNDGNIVNIVDIHSQRPLKDYAIYNISKAGIDMLTKTLAKELAPNIRVNGVSPGSILWPENAAEITAENKQKMLDKIPLKKQGCAEDIAKAVLFLAENEYITGQIISVDGGRTLNQ